MVQSHLLIFQYVFHITVQIVPHRKECNPWFEARCTYSLIPVHIASSLKIILSTTPYEALICTLRASFAKRGSLPDEYHGRLTGKGHLLRMDK